jgi:hypothetical protein
MLRRANARVVTDRDYDTWKAYKVEAWPTLFVIDKQGPIRWRRMSEKAPIPKPKA